MEAVVYEGGGRGRMPLWIARKRASEDRAFSWLHEPDELGRGAVFAMIAPEQKEALKTWAPHVEPLWEKRSFTARSFVGADGEPALLEAEQHLVITLIRMGWAGNVALTTDDRLVVPAPSYALDYVRGKLLGVRTEVTPERMMEARAALWAEYRAAVEAAIGVVRDALLRHSPEKLTYGRKTQMSGPPATQAEYEATSLVLRPVFSWPENLRAALRRDLDAEGVRWLAEGQHLGREEEALACLAPEAVARLRALLGCE